MDLNERTIFLVDAIGAFSSVLLLGVVLPAVQDWIGMPLDTLYLLACFPVIFCIYSSCCFRFADHSRPIWLRIIMAANLMYCLLTLVLLVVHSAVLTPLGITYFVVEQIVVVCLVGIEYRICSELG